jgi:hypothetical protein
MRKIILVAIAIGIVSLLACSKDSANTSGAGFDGGSGQGGSLARFTVVNNHLYTIDDQNLSVFDVSAADKPVFKNRVNIGFEIEALFPYKDKLFIASRNAMFIYNISNPEQPIQESRVQHFTGCDPVVVNDSIAFLTIHGGNACGSSLNQLNIYDIRDVKNPQLMQTLPMTNPYGLGLKDSILYVCDNGAGLRLLNVNNPVNTNEIDILTEDNYLDVIPSGDLLIGMLTDGIAFLDISDPAKPIKLSEIKN